MAKPAGIKPSAGFRFYGPMPPFRSKKGGADRIKKIMGTLLPGAHGFENTSGAEGEMTPPRRSLLGRY